MTEQPDQKKRKIENEDALIPSSSSDRLLSNTSRSMASTDSYPGEIGKNQCNSTDVHTGSVEIIIEGSVSQTNVFHQLSNKVNPILGFYNIMTNSQIIELDKSSLACMIDTISELAFIKDIKNGTVDQTNLVNWMKTLKTMKPICILSATYPALKLTPITQLFKGQTIPIVYDECCTQSFYEWLCKLLIKLHVIIEDKLLKLIERPFFLLHKKQYLIFIKHALLAKYNLNILNEDSLYALLVQLKTRSRLTKVIKPENIISIVFTDKAKMKEISKDMMDLINAKNGLNKESSDTTEKSVSTTNEEKDRKTILTILNIVGTNFSFMQYKNKWLSEFESYKSLLENYPWIYYDESILKIFNTCKRTAINPTTDYVYMKYLVKIKPEIILSLLERMIIEYEGAYLMSFVNDILDQPLFTLDHLVSFIKIIYLQNETSNK